MIYTTPSLETERLFLKRGTLEDYQKVYEYDFTKLRNIAGEFEFVKQDLNNLYNYSVYASETEEVYDWIVYLKNGVIPIANIVADREIKEIKATELSYNLHPNYWGNGYVQEAVIEIMNFLFENGFENVICGYSEGNQKSKRLNEKLGFILYSEEKDAWVKNGIAITDYKTIMSKDKFYDLYSKENKNNNLLK